MNENMRFKEVALLWIREKTGRVKPTTMAAYRLNLEKHLLPIFENHEKIKEEEVQAFINRKLKDGLSQKRIKDVLVVLKMVLRFQKKIDPSVETNFRLLFPREYVNKELQVFSLIQQKKLEDYINTNLSSKNLGILICLHTGLRIGEICALKWKDIDLKQGLLSVNKTLYRIYRGKNERKKTELILSPPKTNHSYRVIPLPDSLLEKLNGLKGDQTDECYIISGSSCPLEPRTYREHYRKLLNKLELPKVKFHGLRHSFATRCIESDCDYKTVSEILGHSDISTTMNLYVHPSRDQKKKCLEKMLSSIT